MNIGEHLYSAFQGFCIGSIVMAYVANYNTSRLPIAILCIAVSILSRLGSKK